MVWALRTSLHLEALDEVLLLAGVPGVLGLTEEHGRATAYLAERVPLAVAGEWESVPEQDWHALWRGRLEPVTVGAVTVRAPWHQAGSGIELVIDPGQAFGTGHHETTTGCLAALQELDLEGRSVLDVGTGSGVLAISAALLGAARVDAIDLDPVAIEAAQRNVDANQVGERVRVAVTSLPLPEAEGGRDRYDVVVANLDTNTVVALAGELAAVLAPGGTLVVSGVGIERSEEAERALTGAGLAVWPRKGREWTILTAR